MKIIIALLIALLIALGLSTSSYAITSNTDTELDLHLEFKLQVDKDNGNPVADIYNFVSFAGAGGGSLLFTFNPLYPSSGDVKGQGSIIFNPGGASLVSFGPGSKSDDVNRTGNINFNGYAINWNLISKYKSVKAKSSKSGRLKSFKGKWEGKGKSHKSGGFYATATKIDVVDSVPDSSSTLGLLGLGLVVIATCKRFRN